MAERTVEQIADIGKCQKLLPKESDFIGREGYQRTYRDGGYDWSFKYRPNVDGKVTKTGGEILDRVRPFQRADVARHQKLESEKRRVPAKDHSGSIRMLEPQVAEEAGRLHGWNYVGTRGGARIVAGDGGMLWRSRAGGWEPTGRRCLGQPFFGGALVPRRGIQYDPDGDPWRWIAGAWRKVV